MAYAVQTFGQAQRALPRCDGISNFRAVIRKLWTDHVVWTRQYVISALSDLPDKKVALDRLLAAQDAIGKSVVPFFGPANGLKLAKLLRDYTVITGEVTAAAKTDETSRLAAAQQAWSANVLEIAKLLNGANPRWPQKTLMQMLQLHLDLTTKEIVARLKHDWSGDVAAFDGGYDHMLKFADFMANGMLAMVEAVAGRRR